MAKRNKKSTRRRLAPRPVKGTSQPLPAETRARLAFKLARARGEGLVEAETRADEAEARLQRHRQGGRKLEADGNVYVGEDRVAFCAQVHHEVQRERELCPHIKDIVEIRRRVAKRHKIPGRYGDDVTPSPKWVYDRCEEVRTKK